MGKLRECRHVTSSRLRRAGHGSENASVRAAAAEISAEGLPGLFECEIGSLAKQRVCRHDHAVRAVAALRGLFGNECGLYAVRLVWSPKTFKGRYCVPCYLFDWRHTRADRLVIYQYCTSATLCQTAAEFGRTESKNIAQDVEKRLVRVPGIHR